MSARASTDDDLTLNDGDVAAVRLAFASGSADWALFGYGSPPDDPRCKLTLIRLGLSTTDGPVQDSLSSQTIVYGVFCVNMGEALEGRGPLAPSGTPDSKADGRESPSLGSALVSFGFYG